MKAQNLRSRHHCITMSTSLRVSPSIHGYHFDTAARKKAVANIFERIDEESLQRLFKKTGDKKAEERARIIFAIEQDMEEKAMALMALKQRTKDKLIQFLKIAKYSLNLIGATAAPPEQTKMKDTGYRSHRRVQDG